MVTISGHGFGDRPGVLTLSRYVVGCDLESLEATVTSWDDDELTCTVGDGLPGILCVQVETAAGLTDASLVYLGKSEGVYEQDLPLASETGDPFVSEEPGDLETKGALVGLGCKLYYLPCHQMLEGVPAQKRMLVFDLKTNAWSQAPELPEWLSGISACIYEGKLVVEGATLYLNELGVWTDDFPEGQQAEERVYVFDPLTGAWTRASDKGMRDGQSIFNDGGTLKLIGGYEKKDDEDGFSMEYPFPLMSYDLTEGATMELDDIPLACVNPSVASYGGTTLVYTGLTGVVMRIRDGVATKLGKCGLKPLYGSDEELFGEASQYEYDPYINRGTIMPVEGGFVLVGPPSKLGIGDTYFLADDSNTYVAFPKRASEARLYSQVACAYRGRIFVIAASRVESSGHLFRATAADTIEYPGDIPCEPDPEPGDDQPSKDDEPGGDDEPGRDPDEDTKPAGEKDSKKSAKKDSKKDTKKDSKKSAKANASSTSRSTATATTGSTSSTQTNQTSQSADRDYKALAQTADPSLPPQALLGLAVVGFAVAAAGVASRRRC